MDSVTSKHSQMSRGVGTPTTITPNRAMLPSRTLNNRTKCSPGKQVVTISSQSKVLMAHKQSSSISDSSSAISPKRVVGGGGGAVRAKFVATQLFGGRRDRSPPMVATDTSATASSHQTSMTTVMEKQVVSPPVDQKLFKKGATNVMLVPRKHTKRHSEVPISMMSLHVPIIPKPSGKHMMIGQQCTDRRLTEANNQEEDVPTSARQEQCLSATAQSDICSVKHRVSKTDAADHSLKSASVHHHTKHSSYGDFLGQPMTFANGSTVEQSYPGSLQMTKQNSVVSATDGPSKPRSTTLTHATQQAFSKSAATQPRKLGGKAIMNQPQPKMVKKVVIQGMQLNPSCRRRKNPIIVIPEPSQSSATIAAADLSPIRETNTPHKLQQHQYSNQKRRQMYQEVSESQSSSLMNGTTVMSEKSPAAARKTNKKSSKITGTATIVNVCKRSKNLTMTTAEMQQQSSKHNKANRKSLIQGTHNTNGTSSAMSGRNPEETTPVMMKAHSTTVPGGAATITADADKKPILHQPVKQNSARQLFKAKKLVLEKQLSQNSSSAHKPLSQNSMSSKPQQARVTAGGQPSARRGTSNALKLNSAKTKTMAQVQAQMRNYPDNHQHRHPHQRSSFNVQKSSQMTTTQDTKNLQIRLPPEGSYSGFGSDIDGAIELKIDVESNEDDDDMVERFQTVEKSPTYVPKVKICLNDFQMEMSDVQGSPSPPTNNANSSQITVTNNAGEDHHPSENGDNQSQFYKKMLVKEQFQFKLPTAPPNEKQDSTKSCAHSMNSYLRHSNPFQQGGGIKVGDGQTGGDESFYSNRNDMSMIPQEDCNTQTKSANMKKLEEQQKSHDFTVMSPRAIVTSRSKRRTRKMTFFSKQATTQRTSPKVYRQSDRATYASSPITAGTAAARGAAATSATASGASKKLYQPKEQQQQTPTIKRDKLKETNPKNSSNPNQASYIKKPNTTRHTTTGNNYRQLRDFNPGDHPYNLGSSFTTRIKRSSSNGIDEKKMMVQCTPSSLAKRQSFTRNHGVAKAATESQKMFTFGQQQLQASLEYSKDVILAPERTAAKRDQSECEEKKSLERQPQPTKLIAQDSGIGIGLNSLFGSLKKSTFTQIQSFKQSFQSILGGSHEPSAQADLAAANGPLEESKSNAHIVVDDYNSIDQVSLKTIVTMKSMTVIDSQERQYPQLRNIAQQDLSLKSATAIIANKTEPTNKHSSFPKKVTSNISVDEANSLLQTSEFKRSRQMLSQRQPSPTLHPYEKQQPKTTTNQHRQDQVHENMTTKYTKPFNIGLGSDDNNYGCNPIGEPSDCLLQFGHLLTQPERSEILSYQQIYFVGTSHAKNQRKQSLQSSNQTRSRDFSNSKSPTRALAGSRDSGLMAAIYGSAQKQQKHCSLTRRRNLNLQANNQGYDTATGFYQIISGDHLDYRYETLKELGRGTFGQVLLCMDHKDGSKVAVKISKNLSYAGIENCMREVRLLEQANSIQTQYSNHIVTLLDKFKFRQHMCLVFELLDGNDLYKEMKTSLQMAYFSDMARLKKVVSQVVQGLCHLKESGIVHCDLKPENLMFSNQDKTEVKIVDLGSACSRNERGFSYVCSRYYRAPEMVLTKGADYDFAVDMWSLGCITAELYNGLPLFLASSQHDLIEFQSLYCGGFEREEVLCYDNFKPFLKLGDSESLPEPIPDPKPRFQSVKPKVQSTIIKEVLCRKKRDENDKLISSDLADDRILGLVSQDERLMIDFISNCLSLSPWRRMTCERALQHPFIAH